MNTCVGCRIVEYLFVYWPSGLQPRASTWMHAFYYNLNRPDGAKYSQTVYIPKYSQHAHVRGFCDCEVNVLRSEHLIYHKNDLEPLIYGIFRKSVTFHLWGRRLIPESLAQEVQAV